MAQAYRIAGLSDEVRVCDICGRQELKGTVILHLLDADKQMAGEIYAGQACASRVAGVPRTAIRHRARYAMALQQLAAEKRDRERHQAKMDASGAWLQQRGLERRWATVKLWRESPEGQAFLQEWEAMA